MSRFDNFAATRTGQALHALVALPEMVPAYVALSAIGKPAVQALAGFVSPVISALPSKSERDAASQFVGWAVARIMRDLGFRLIKERGRVSGAPYRTGAVWQEVPMEVRIVRSLPGATPRRIELRIKASDDGPVGEWEAVHTAGDPLRRIRTVMEISQSLSEALAHAIAYARRWRYPVIFVHDPQNLVPDPWPEASDISAPGSRA